jgi:hypothetical protein
MEVMSLGSFVQIVRDWGDWTLGNWRAPIERDAPSPTRNDAQAAQNIAALRAEVETLKRKIDRIECVLCFAFGDAVLGGSRPPPQPLPPEPELHLKPFVTIPGQLLVTTK